MVMNWTHDQTGLNGVQQHGVQVSRHERAFCRVHEYA